MTAQTTPAHHLWASPGRRAGDPLEALVVGFDRSALDFVVKLPQKVGDAISQFELPHICTVRPHEDPHVEAWLEHWVDGIRAEGDVKQGTIVVEDSLELTGRTLAALISLAGERPEVCPMLSSQLERFESILAAWLRQWPIAEPAREGLPCTAGGAIDGAASAEELELELHVALSFLRSGVPSTSIALSSEVAGHFRQVALGWIFKLDSLYGLTLLSQPERVSAACMAADALGNVEPGQLSLLAWDINEVEELLRCPFFRPQELSLWRFAQRWRVEGASGPTNGVDTDASISDALLWELLPPRVSLLSISGDTGQPSDDSQPNVVEGVDQSVIEGATQNNGQVETSGFVPGNSFVRVSRFPDPVMGQHDDPASLHLRPTADSEGLRCWNATSESEVVGAARQMIASRVPMSSAGGVYRLDLRVVSGVDSETAHLFEVGLAADPTLGVQFKICGPGAFRPQSEGQATPFFGLVSVLDSLLEGVRMTVEIDFDERSAMVRNIPAVEGVESASAPTPLAPWLDVRANHQVQMSRPPGEQEDSLFRDQAEHLHELIAEGMLRDDLADTVLSDGGARCIRGAGAPDVPEEYYFYIVVPAGMEVEIY